LAADTLTASVTSFEGLPNDTSYVFMARAFG
jgi:hypothetical protein